MRSPFEIIRNRGLLIEVGKVCLVLVDPLTGQVQDRRDGVNLITDNGDLFYAHMGVDDAAHPDDLFVSGVGGAFDGEVETWAGVTAAPSKAGTRATLTAASGTSLGIKGMTSTWPKVNDLDARNLGAGPDVISYLAEFLTSESNGTITDVVITNPSPGAAEKLLVWSDGFSPLVKSVANTLAVFLNHTSTGV